MVQELESALRSQRRKQGLVLLLVILISLPLLAVLLSSSVLIKVSPNEISKSAIIRVSKGFALPVSGKYWTFSNVVSFNVSSLGYRDEVVLFEKDSELNAIEVMLQPLPGKIRLQVETGEAFTLLVPELQIRSSSRIVEFDAPAGVLQVKIDGPKLEDFSQRLEIKGKGHIQSVVLKPKKIKETKVTFSLQPQHAEVFVDGKYYETTAGNFSESLAEGVYSLLISATGYVSTRREVQVVRSGDLELGVFHLNPEKVKFFANSIPSGSALFLNDKFIGETPQTMLVSPNRKYDVQMRKPGFKSLRRSLTPSIGEDEYLELSFLPEKSLISLVASPPGSVFRNGALVGTSPLELEVKIGDKLRVEKPEYAPEEVVISSVLPKDRIIKVPLILETRKLFVESPSQLEIAGMVFKKFERSEIEIVKDLSVRMLTTIPDIYVSDSVVTRESYAEFKGVTSELVNSTVPQTSVSWKDAAAYCNWLSQKLSLTAFYDFRKTGGITYVDFNSEANGFRLPTLTEWIYLISDGSPNSLGEFPWGNSFHPIPRGIGNISGRERSEKTGAHIVEYLDSFDGLSPVKSFRASNMGLFDLVGNTREWLHNTTTVNAAYFGSKSGTRHLVVGSSYMASRKDDFESIGLQSSAFGEADVGFRVVRSIK